MEEKNEKKKKSAAKKVDASTLEMIYVEILPNVAKDLSEALVLLTEGIGLEEGEESGAPSSEWTLTMALYLFITALQIRKDQQSGALLVARNFALLSGLEWDKVKQTAFSMIKASDDRLAKEGK